MQLISIAEKPKYSNYYSGTFEKISCNIVHLPVSQSVNIIYAPLKLPLQGCFSEHASLHLPPDM